MIRIIIILLFFNGFVFAQDSGNLYKYLHFEDFIEDKVKNDSIFMVKMYETIGNYPESARKNLVEAKVEVLVLNHGNSFWDFIFSKEACLFNIPDEAHFRKLFSGNTNDEFEKFFTRFYIVYDLKPWRYRAGINQHKYKGLYNKNSFVKFGYKVPNEYYEN